MTATAVERVKAVAQRLRNLHRCAADLASEITTALADLDAPEAPASPAPARPALRRVAVTCPEHGTLERTVTASDARTLERERRCPVCRREGCFVAGLEAESGSSVTSWRARAAAPNARVCAVCGEPSIARGLCRVHYYRARRGGTLRDWPLRRRAQEEDR